MKTIIMITAFVVFLILSALSGLKIWQVKKVTREKTKLESKYASLESMKRKVDIDLAKMKAENKVLLDEKEKIEQRFRDSEYDREKEKQAFKDKLREISSIPPDTIYQFIFARYPVFDQPLKYRFSESQIRGIHLDILERDHYNIQLGKTENSLADCKGLNEQNNKIIGNLSGQVSDLEDKNKLSEDQNGVLKDELKLSAKQVNKQKRKTFLWKGSTVVSLAGMLLFVFK